MTVDDVRRRVDEIKRFNGPLRTFAGPRAEDWNCEAAHEAEDALWYDVLRAIADGAENPDELARAALETANMSFTRWYA